MLVFSKPQKADLSSVGAILAQWNDRSEAEKYEARIEREINGQTEFDMRFWVAKLDNRVIGIGGLSNCQPKLRPFIKAENPQEIKAVYLHRDFRSRGYGRKLINYLKKEAEKQGCKQLLLLSAEKYYDTAYGFYQRLGFSKQGYVPGGSPGKKMAVFSKML